MTREEALKLVDEIEEAANGGGFADAAALRHLKSLLSRLRSYPTTGEKTSDIGSWADVLFSARKHQRWGGPEPIRHFIRGDCASLRKIIDRFAEAQS